MKWALVLVMINGGNPSAHVFAFFPHKGPCVEFAQQFNAQPYPDPNVKRYAVCLQTEFTKYNFLEKPDGR